MTPEAQQTTGTPRPTHARRWRRSLTVALAAYAATHAVAGAVPGQAGIAAG